MFYLVTRLIAHAVFNAVTGEVSPPKTREHKYLSSLGEVEREPERTREVEGSGDVKQFVLYDTG